MRRLCKSISVNSTATLGYSLAYTAVIKNSTKEVINLNYFPDSVEQVFHHKTDFDPSWKLPLDFFPTQPKINGNDCGKHNEIGADYYFEVILRFRCYSESPHS